MKPVSRRDGQDRASLERREGERTSPPRRSPPPAGAPPSGGAVPFGLNRRRFLELGMLTTAGAVGGLPGFALSRAAEAGAAAVTVADLPRGGAPLPVPLPHFPSRLHAFVWRNWQLVPLSRLAQVVEANPPDLLRLGRALGLGSPPPITADLQRRSALTVIRRNWHLLPYEQLLTLLGWTPEQLAYSLREDDFLFIKLGNLKPRCAPLRYTPPDAAARARERAIAHTLRATFPAGPARMADPLFGFVTRLSTPPATPTRPAAMPGVFSPRFCYSYFALYGDPLLDTAADPYPPGLLARLAAAGVDGVWLQAVLYKLAPFPWDRGLSARFEERLAHLRALVARAKQFGLGVYLYLNEPRAMPLRFYAAHPELKGVVEGDHAALCTSVPAVRDYVRDAVATIGRAAPELAGFFTITGSENLSNCWSHGGGARCPRCAARGPADVIGELNGVFQEGIRQSGAAARLLVWDWGWAEEWVEGIIQRLPREAALMSVSEWGMPFQRGGVASVIGEYSMSVVGPGQRARRHWDWARQRGLRTVAKIQAGNTWELSTVPYIPAVENVARHALNLRGAGVGGLMLGWTLGGYPSPNLEVVAEVGAASVPPTPEAAMHRVAERRYGTRLAPAVVRAWQAFSAAFDEFPFHPGLLYNGPQQLGPANLLWAQPTGYSATMTGFPYDDLDGWRQVYSTPVFIAQFDKVADGFAAAVAGLRKAMIADRAHLSATARAALQGELRVGEAAALHFRSTANQARFVQARRTLAAGPSRSEATAALARLEGVLTDELRLAQRLHDLQVADSRLGFEASNQYFYIPLDLAEKVINCRDLLDRWLPAQRQALAARTV